MSDDRDRTKARARATPPPGLLRDIVLASVTGLVVFFLIATVLRFAPAVFYGPAAGFSQVSVQVP